MFDEIRNAVNKILSLVGTSTGTSVVDDDTGAVKTTLASRIAGENLSRDLLAVLTECTPGAKISASALVYDGACNLVGWQCVTSTSLVIDVYNNTAASGTKIVESKSLTAGDIVNMPIPPYAGTGLYFSFASGTGSLIPLYKI